MSVGDNNDVDRCWYKVSAALIDPVIAILSGAATTVTSTSKENALLYSLIHRLCSGRNGVKHGHSLRVRLDQSICATTSTMISIFEECRDDQLYRRFVFASSLFEHLVEKIALAMRYVDKNNLGGDDNVEQELQYRSSASLDSRALSWRIFTLRVLDVIHPKLFIAIYHRIKEYRATATASSSSDCHSAIRVLFLADPHLAHYRLFETFLMQKTLPYYRVQLALFAELPLTESIKELHRCITTERGIIQNFLHASSAACFTDLFHEHIAVPSRTRYFHDRLGSELSDLVSERNAALLSMLYDVYCNDASSRSAFADLFQEHIVQRGRIAQKTWRRHRQGQLLKYSDAGDTCSIVPFDAVDMNLIEGYLTLFKEFRALATNVFKSDPYVVLATKKGFSCLLNDGGGSTSSAALAISNASGHPVSWTSTEILAKYINVYLHRQHPLLVKHSRTYQHVETSLNDLGDLFSVSPDHDQFMSVYSKDLATRLLTSSSYSLVAETSMIEKFKLRAGARHTSRLEGMVSDMIKSKAHSDKFSECMRQQPGGPPPMQMTIKLMTRGFWLPSVTRGYDLASFVPPGPFAAISAQFTQHFLLENERRLLTWKYQYGSCNIGMHCSDPPVELHTTTFQACVLLLFNHHTVLTLKGVRSLLNIDEDLAKRLLHSLSCGKFQILRKRPSTPFVTDTDSFAVNIDFESRAARRVRLPKPSLADTNSKPRTEQDHTVAVQATIVRILKRIKTIRHEDLIDEVVTTLLRFKISAKAVASRVDYLLENEFIERDAEAPDIYHFIP